ncbi:MAG: hypothetical protein HYZ53_15695 [Planctomycetes bacterium]|nr:hypothetical protein [Planctomycetota bacterium]
MKTLKKSKARELPVGWNHQRVKQVLAHYEGQADAEAAAEDEAAFKGRPETVIELPHELLPRVRRMIAKHKAARAC